MHSQIVIMRSIESNQLFSLVCIQYDADSNIISREIMVTGLTYEQASEYFK